MRFRSSWHRPCEPHSSRKMDRVNWFHLRRGARAGVWWSSTANTLQHIHYRRMLRMTFGPLMNPASSLDLSRMYKSCLRNILWHLHILWLRQSYGNRGEEMTNAWGTLFFFISTMGKSKCELWYFMSKIRNPHYANMDMKTRTSKLDCTIRQMVSKCYSRTTIISLKEPFTKTRHSTSIKTGELKIREFYVTMSCQFVI